MLKAVLFDDEYIVIKGLEKMIDWTSFGIELAGTAGDGYAALDTFRTLNPDIVLTDIRMPGLDGLQLIEEIMREAPETYCIVFSGFNEFKYVKRAIELGVSAYMEKPITIQSIEKAIQKAKDHINEKQETRSLQRKWEQNRSELLEKATLDLILFGVDAESKWKEAFGPDAQRVISTTVFVVSADLLLPETEKFSAVYVRNGQERVLVVYHYESPSHDFWEQWIQASDQMEIIMGEGQTYPGLIHASLSYKEAHRAMRCARFLNYKGIVRFQDLGDLMTNPKRISDQEEAIILSMRAGNKTELLGQVDQFIEWIMTEKLDPAVAEREILKLIYLALDVSRESDSNALFMEHYMPHIEIQEAAARGNIAEWFRKQFDKIADLFMESREHTKHLSVVRARSYIEQNFSRDLSLQEVAEHVGMNASYLSVLFKEATGENYIKFLTRYRMELAKLMLQKGLKVKEVSEKVGYHTYRHFSEVFKKYVGLSPGQYKEEQGSQL
jgi:two-component system response regulator YesN